MSKNVKQLYDRLRALKWPALGKSVGDFALYDALLAGCADLVTHGGQLDGSKIPAPDNETVSQINLIRQKDELTHEEKAFLEYFDLLEEIRHVLVAN
jgi:hypothetical protein